jgi:preprotein translocase subunit SecD
MAEKDQGMWTRLVTDWRVILLVICLLIAVVLLGPSYSNGQFNTNLKFGLDFVGGSTVTYKLTNQSNPNETISEATLDLTKQIMTNKINKYGLSSTAIRSVTDSQNNAYMQIDFAGMTVEQANTIVGTPGKFEMRIQTTGNESAHVLYGEDVAGVSSAQYFTDSGAWGVPIMLTQKGAQELQQACIQYGATTDPNNHPLIMLLDGVEFNREPLSSELASSISKSPETRMNAMLGSNATAQAQAENVYVQMSSGSLPVQVQEVSAGQVPAAQGATFKTIVIIAMILAQIAIGAVMYFRYKEPRIILPMFLTSIFEVIILLGVAAAIGWQIDLPSVAGIIAVIGTGVDQLIIITDEVLTTGKAPTTKKILQKLSTAFKIIVASAATVVVAMIPLYYMGFGSLKGFAITTILGVFIGILITRPAYGRIISDILNK